MSRAGEQSEADKPYTIAIVGGALAGATLLVHLRERFGAALREGRLQVIAFERTPEPGTGLAWSASMASDCQLTNLPVGALHLSDELEPSFEDWLRRTHPLEFGTDPCLAAAYPPRRYFGEYVGAILAELTAEPGIAVRAGVEVIGLSKLLPRTGGSAPRFQCELRSAESTSESPSDSLVADGVVLCTGAATTGSKPWLSHLVGCTDFVESPWPASTLTEQVEGARSVAILGTGLSAIDAVKHLRREIPEVPVVLTSRRARFHVVVRDLRQERIANQPPYECQVLTAEKVASLPPRCSLEEVVDLIKREMESCLGEHAVDWDDLLSGSHDGVAEWRAHATAHREGRLSRWQLAIVAVEPRFPQLWQRLDDADRERWLASTERTVFQNYTNPLPLESAAAVLEWIDSGRVRVLGGLRSVQPDPQGGFRLHCAEDGAAASPTHVTHCVNCTGVGFDVALDRSALMRQLLRDGIVEPHRFGGVVVDPDSFRVPGGGPLFVVGHHARGVRYLTSGLGFLRSMIESVVGSFAGAIELSSEESSA